jgi:hypothetical protein
MRIKKISASVPISGQIIDSMEQDSATNAPSINAVKDYVANNGGSGGGSSEEIYSTEETVIGTWLGKPLYRKAYNFTTSSSALNMQIKIDNIDYDYITMTDKSVILDNVGNSKSMPMNYVTSTTFICRANVQYTSVAGWFVYFVYPSDVKNKKGIVVVEYTKTTD